MRRFESFSRYIRHLQLRRIKLLLLSPVNHSTPKQFLVIIIIQFDKLPIQFNLINLRYDVVLLEITQMFHHTIAAPIFNEFFFTNVINQWMKFCKKIKNKISFIDYDNYLLNLT